MPHSSKAEHLTVNQKVVVSESTVAAMSERVIKECKKHGPTEHYRDSSGRLRCMKCRTEAVQRRREKIKELAVQYKGGKCCICGYNRYLGALEFHHLNPTEKDFGIGTKGYTRSFEKVKGELDKCILVCSNCHKEIHAGLVSV